MKKYLLVIKADTNDADYVYTVEEKTEKQLDIERLRRIAKAISTCKANYNWCVGETFNEEFDVAPEELYKDVLSPEDIEWFDELRPHGEYGIHTIEYINVYEISSRKELLK